MPYTQDIETCRASAIGEGGVSDDAMGEALKAAGPALSRLSTEIENGRLPALAIARWTDDLPAIEETARRLSDHCSDVIVLGTGGSSLSGICYRAISPGNPGPRLHFLENVDPEGFEDALLAIDLAQAGLLIVSKSGTTAETLSQAFALIPRLAAARGEAALPEVCAVISDPTPEGGGLTPLRAFAGKLGLPVLDHEAGIGGRFACLSNVGLLPARLRGLDPAEIRAGAEEVLTTVMEENDASAVPPAAGAALNVAIARERGLTQAVMMPYLDRLAPFAAWYSQLWAESLGKDGRATTPIAALGTRDQHSQLQLWLDGPADKLYTLIFGAPKGTGPDIAPPDGTGPGLEYLASRRMGDLLAAEQEATRETLVGKGRPVRVIEVPRADGRALGGLMMHFMVETILAGDLLGIEPFGQPAVEAGKVLAREKLAAMGAG
ncbi:MAG TPA: glucose-6-phosphate isomerase [Alphaproteobacteria bacterium]|nr:glucose-6-phosphate isomerase [Alphaproteobacteria bacterium]